jgi:hypothetical protein
VKTEVLRYMCAMLWDEKKENFGKALSPKGWHHEKKAVCSQALESWQKKKHAIKAVTEPLPCELPGSSGGGSVKANGNSYYRLVNTMLCDRNLEGFTRLGAIATAAELTANHIGVNHPWWEQCWETYKSMGNDFVDTLHNINNRPSISNSGVDAKDVPAHSKGDLYNMYKNLNSKISAAHKESTQSGNNGPDISVYTNDLQVIYYHDMLKYRGVLQAVISSLPTESAFDSGSDFISPVVVRRGNSKNNSLDASLSVMKEMSSSVAQISSAISSRASPAPARWSPATPSVTSSTGSGDPLAKEKERLLGCKLVESRYTALQRHQEAMARCKEACDKAKLDLEKEKMKLDPDEEEIDWFKEQLSVNRASYKMMQSMEKELLGVIEIATNNGSK